MTESPEDRPNVHEHDPAIESPGDGRREKRDTPERQRDREDKDPKPGGRDDNAGNPDADAETGDEGIE